MTRATRCEPAGNSSPLKPGEVDLLDPTSVRSALDTMDDADAAWLRGVITDTAHRMLLDGATHTAGAVLAGLTSHERHLVFSAARALEDAAARLAGLARTDDPDTSTPLDKPG